MQYYINHYYHVFNRGNNKQPIFFEKDNYLYLLKLLESNQIKHSIQIIAYCLMPNHYHFLLRQESNIQISNFLKSTFQSYAQAINQRYKRSGHLFEGKPKAKLIDNDAYLLHICRYIHLNPVVSNIVSDIEEWEYSNYLEFISKRNGKLFEPAFLETFYYSSVEYQEFVLEYHNVNQEIGKYI